MLNDTVTLSSTEGKRKVNMMFLAIIVGAIAMVILRAIPVFGAIIAGFVAGIIAQGMGRGALAGFLSGTIVGILATVVFTGIGGFWGAIIGGPPGAVLGAILGAVTGGTIFIALLYYGFLGLIGGILGGFLRRQRD